MPAVCGLHAGVIGQFAMPVLESQTVWVRRHAKRRSLQMKTPRTWPVSPLPSLDPPAPASVRPLPGRAEGLEHR